MRRGPLILLLIFTGNFLLFCANPAFAAKSMQSMREQLRWMSAVGLNISTQKHCDSLILLGRQVEALAHNAGDMELEFKASQIQVNAYAIVGNLTQAVNKAQELLDRAHTSNDHSAKGLALQALGDTYMFSGKPMQADSLFAEAAPYLIDHSSPSIQSELRLQHLHVYLDLHKFDEAAQEIESLQTLLPKISGPERDACYFLLSGYQALLAIHFGDLGKAGALIEDLGKHDRPGNTSLWLQSLRSEYYLRTEEYDKALAYCDSVLIVARKGTNWNILRQALLAKANLMEKMNRDNDAGILYERIYQTIDSLYKRQYTAQIDSLHVTYWIDQQHTANITRRNSLFTKLISGLCVLMVLTAAGVLLVRRRNAQLVRSRLKLERLHKESEDALRTKSLFLSNMSHELRTPLNAITGFSSILTDEPDLDDQTRGQCSDYIRQNADLLLNLINDVVDLAELKDDSIRFSYAPCEMVGLCHSVLKTVENVKRTDAQLQFVTDLQRLDVTTDKDRLQQVLINLLINSTKFTKEGTITLRLEVDTQAREAIFSVEDTGCGIPAEKQARIFERFEKLHEGIQGAGLGLSICKLIVDHTGGRIWIDPEYTLGARFVFTCPLTPKDQAL